MKRQAFTIIFLFLTVLLCAQFCWDEGGKPIIINPNFEWYKSACTLEDGSFALAWLDESCRMRQVQVAKFSETGENLWQNPVFASQDECSFPKNVRMSPTTGGLAVCWHEYYYSSYICFQMLDLAGNRLCGENGFRLQIPGDYINQYYSWLVPDPEGGVYLLWSIPGYPRIVNGIRFEADGSISEGWSEEGNILFCTLYGYDMEIVSDGAGGIIIMAEDYNDVTLQRINQSGELMWGAGGIFRHIDGNLVEKKLRVNTSEDYSIYVVDQYNFWYDILHDDFNGNGEFLTNYPEFLYHVPEQSNYISFGFSDDDTSIVSWKTNGTIKAQKCSVSEGELWEEGGIIISDAYLGNTETDLIPDSSGGCYFIERDRFLPDTSFGCQYANSEGNLLFEDGWYVIDTVIDDLFDGYYHETISVGSGEFSGLFWFEHSDGQDKVKMQVLSTETGITLEEEGHDTIAYTPIYTNYYLRTANNDYTAFVWGDSNYETSRLFAQVLENNQGEQLFPESPLEIAINEDFSLIPEGVRFNSGNDFMYCAFKSYDSDGNFSRYIQALDMEGNRLYGDEGLLLSSAEGTEFDCYPRLKADPSGMLVLFIEQDLSYEEGIAWKLQKYNENSAIWDEPVTFCAGTSGHHWYRWIDDYFVWAHDDVLRVLKFDSDGNIDPAWNGQYIEQAAHGNVSLLEVIQEESGGCTFLWYAEGNLYGQKLDSNGNKCWDEDGREYDFGGGYVTSLNITDDHFYVTTHKGNPLAYYLNKFDFEGNTLWDSEVYLEPSISGISPQTMLWNDHILFYYHKINLNHDIYLKAYNAAGELLETTPETGLPISESIANQFLYSVLPTSNGSHILFWHEDRFAAPEVRYFGSSHIAQKVDLQELFSEENELTPASCIRNYPNPFHNTTTFEISDPNYRGIAELFIYNIKGQLVRNEVITQRTFEWSGEDNASQQICSGIYLYKIKGQDFSETGKLVFLGLK